MLCFVVVVWLLRLRNRQTKTRSPPVPQPTFFQAGALSPAQISEALDLKNPIFDKRHWVRRFAAVSCRRKFIA